MSRSLVARLLQVALAAAAFLATAAGFRATAGWPRTMGMDVRARAFFAHADDYDCVYVGSSHVFRSLVPGVIDPLLGTPGRPFRSFNLGFEGMEAVEIDAMVGRVLARRPSRLRWLVLEATRYPEDWGMRGLLSDRSLWCRDAATTCYLLRRVALSERPLGEKLDLARAHVLAWLFAATGTGQGPLALFRALGADPAAEAEELASLLANGGYQKETDPFYRRHRGLAAARQSGGDAALWANYAADVAALADPAVLGEPDPRADLDRLRGLLASIEEAGVEPVLLVPATLQPRPTFRVAAARGELPPPLDFQDLARFPELFERRHRADPDHLNDLGAAAFSRRFAAEFGPRLLRPRR